MLTSLIGKPSSFFSCGNDHFKVFSLSSISDVNNSFSLQSQKSVFDTSQISSIIIITTVRFDNDQRIGILFNEDTFSFSFRLISRSLFNLFNWFLFFNFFLLSFFVLFLDLSSFFSDSGVFLNHTKIVKIFDHSWNERIIIALSEFFKSNV